MWEALRTLEKAHLDKRGGKDREEEEGKRIASSQLPLLDTLSPPRSEAFSSLRIEDVEAVEESEEEEEEHWQSSRTSSDKKKKKVKKRELHIDGCSSSSSSEEEREIAPVHKKPKLKRPMNSFSDQQSMVEWLNVSREPAKPKPKRSVPVSTRKATFSLLDLGKIPKAENKVGFVCEHVIIPPN